MKRRVRPIFTRDQEVNRFSREVIEALADIDLSSGGVGPPGPAGPAGPPGATGATGVTGQGAYTTTTANYTQPAIGSTVSVSVASTAWMAVGQPLFIMGGGFYVITAIGSGTSVTVRNIGYYDSSVATTVVSSGAGVVASGVLPTRYPPLYTTPYIYYPLNEGVAPGATYANQGSAGAGFDLTVVSTGLDWAAPSPVGTLLANGSRSAATGSLSIGSTNISALGSTMTVECIIKRLTGTATDTFAINCSGVAFGSSGAYNGILIVNAGGGASSLSTNSLAESHTGWMHFMGTYDGATMDIYLNGNWEASQAKTGSITAINAALTVANARGIYGRVAVYDSILPQSYARDVTRALNMWP